MTEHGEELTEDEVRRAQAIEALLDEVGEEAPYGVALIPEYEFEDYARDLADDLGMLQNPEGQSWPYTHIDWKSAANELRMDYSEVEFEGVTYLYR